MTLAEHDSDIKKRLVLKIPQSFVTRFCAYILLRYQVSVYRTIGPLVEFFKRCIKKLKLRCFRQNIQNTITSWTLYI